MRGWVGVDLDGTLAHYDQWHVAEHIGEPVPLMAERVRGWVDKGFEVRIFTARIYGLDGIELYARVGAIQDWLEAKCGLPRLAVTCTKDFHMIELWDDRAVQVIPNTGEPVLRKLDS